MTTTRVSTIRRFHRRMQRLIPSAIPARAAASLIAVAALHFAVPARADEGPTIDHAPLTKFSKGADVTVVAKIRSPMGKGVYEPKVFVRIKGMASFAKIALEPVPGAPDMFAAKLPAALTLDDFDYYLEAFDQEGNGPTRSGDPKAPLQARLVETAAQKSATAAAVSRPSGGAEPGLRYEQPGRAPVSSAQRTVGIIGVGTGGALLVGGLVAGGLAASAKSDMETASANHDVPGFNTAKENALGRAMAANILAGAGLVVGIAGAIVWLTAPSDRPTVSAAPTRGGGAVMISGSF